MHFYKAAFFSLRIQIINGFFDRTAHRAHRHDYMLRLRVAVIVKQPVASARQLIDPCHILLDDRHDPFIKRVTCLTRLKVNIRVLRRSP